MINFQIPSPEALQSRKIFHSCQRKRTENVNEWLVRIKYSITTCAYEQFNDIMLVDKFFSGLNNEDFEQFSQRTTWSEEQLLEFVKEKKWFSHMSNEDNDIDTANNSIPLQVERIVTKDEISSEYSDNNPVNSNDDQVLCHSGSEFDTKIHADRDVNDANYQEIVEDTFRDTRIGIVKSENVPVDNTPLPQGAVPSNHNVKNFVIRVKPVLKSNRTKQDKQQRSFICLICGINCFCRSRLEVHMRKHEHMNKTFECHLCRMQHHRMLGLKVHFSRMHVGIKKERLPCPECEKTFLEQAALDRHIRIHKGLAEVYKCPDCNKEFELRCRMMAHLARHSNTKEEHICEICGQIYGSRKLLSMHRQTHSEMRYKCGVCGLLLKNSNTYRIHQRQHTGERPHKCKICGKTFVTAPSYNKHLMVHNKIKPHACTICSGRFATPYHLKIHMNRHTGNRPFQCQHCQTRFSQPQSLNTHMKRFHKNDNTSIKLLT